MICRFIFFSLWKRHFRRSGPNDDIVEVFSLPSSIVAFSFNFGRLPSVSGQTFKNYLPLQALLRSSERIKQSLFFFSFSFFGFPFFSGGTLSIDASPRRSILTRATSPPLLSFPIVPSLTFIAHESWSEREAHSFSERSFWGQESVSFGSFFPRNASFFSPRLRYSFFLPKSARKGSPYDRSQKGSPFPSVIPGFLDRVTWLHSSSFTSSRGRWSAPPFELAFHGADDFFPFPPGRPSLFSRPRRSCSWFHYQLPFLFKLFCESFCPSLPGQSFPVQWNSFQLGSHRLLLSSFTSPPFPFYSAPSALASLCGRLFPPLYGMSLLVVSDLRRF